VSVRHGDRRGTEKAENAEDGKEREKIKKQQVLLL